MGTKHSEDAHRSFTLLTNYPNQDNPSEKQLDHLQATTGSREQSTLQNSHVLHGKGVAVMPQPQKKENGDYDIFVATVYGEASGQSEVAWKAVGSVMVNRVGKGYWKNATTPGQAAAQNKQFTAYGKPLYKKALQAIQANNMGALAKLTQMYNMLKPIYAGNVITNANFYYSPGTQAEKHAVNPLYQEAPSFSEDSWVKKVDVPGLKETDDFTFYYDPHNGITPP
jgi:hypothetical protein